MEILVTDQIYLTDLTGIGSTRMSYKVLYRFGCHFQIILDILSTNKKLLLNELTQTVEIFIHTVTSPNISCFVGPKLLQKWLLLLDSIK